MVDPPKATDNHEGKDECKDAGGSCHELNRMRRYDERQAELCETETNNDVGKRFEPVR